MKLNIYTWVHTPGKRWIARVPFGTASSLSFGTADGMIFEECSSTELLLSSRSGTVKRLIWISGTPCAGYEVDAFWDCPAEYLEEYFENNEDTFQANVFQNITITYLGRADGAPTFTARFSDGTEMHGIVTEVVRATHFS